MKILVVNTYYDPDILGGAEKSVQYLAEGLFENGYNVEILRIGKNDKEYYSNGIKVNTIKNRNIFYPEQEQVLYLLKPIYHILDSGNRLLSYKLNKKIKEVDPQIIIGNNISGVTPEVYRQAKLHDNKIRNIQFIRNYYYLCTRGTMYNGGECNGVCKRCKLFSNLRTKYFKYIDKTIFISNSLQDKFSEEVDINSYDIINNPVKIDEYTPRKGYEYNPNSISIGYLGRIERIKGVLKIPEVANLSSVSKFYVAGKGDKKIVENLKEHGKIDYLGYVNPPDLFKKIDYLLFPSLWTEPFGRSVIEALAAGVPVISTSHGGPAEIIQNLENGFKINFKEENYTRKIEDYLNKIDNTIYETLSINAIETSKKYDKDNIVKEVVGLVQNIV